ncbi:MAG TPA: winged helix DNA-binding domain-containing protein [Dehalococcoidia bacterium]|nr:winged helix DNA-binding domain-containing protein [Dehalococcoidia bacterium]
MADLLTNRELNRALLARQMLLQRHVVPVEEALERLVGLQAQVPNHPYFALWSRLQDFDPEALSTLINERRAVRTAVMRTTIHLVTARDALALWPLTAPLMKRTLPSTPFGKGTVGLDLDEVVAAGRAALEEKPRTLTELGRLLKARWPDREAINLARSVHYRAPLVQIPPRGLWGRSMQATWTTLESWLGREVAKAPSIDTVLLRYLAAFGPASAADARTWSGLAGLSEAFERLRPQMRAFRDEKGRELFDLPDAPRPEADTPAPVRFLPEYDNVFLSHSDRQRIVREEDRRRFATVNGAGPNAFSLDGFLQGTWRIRRHGDAAILSIETLNAVSKAERRALEEEGEALIAFAAANAAHRSVEFVAN